MMRYLLRSHGKQLVTLSRGMLSLDPGWQGVSPGALNEKTNSRVADLIESIDFESILHECNQKGEISDFVTDFGILFGANLYFGKIIRILNRRETNIKKSTQK